MASFLPSSIPKARGRRGEESKNCCKWTGCTAEPFETVQELVDHVKSLHVDPLLSQDFVMCLWEGCKVYNVPCQKKQWLGQHMRRHTKERPHKCIMNGCNQSFWSLDALHHHLQLHLLPSPSPSISKKKKKDINTAGSEHTAGKESLKNGDGLCSIGTTDETDSASGNGDNAMKSQTHKHYLNARGSLNPPQPLAINGGLIHSDPVDSRTLSVIRKSLISQHMSSVAAEEETSSNGKTAGSVPETVITLKGEIVGQRNTFKSKSETEYLVTWRPRLIPDSWILKDSYNGYKYIPIDDLLHCQRAWLFQSNYLNNPISPSFPSSSSSLEDLSPFLSSSSFLVASIPTKRKRKRN
ncbi:PREDICTED: zinc finger protein AEBP2-like [Amphimedon queenslandica]|uniref:C2H2-type domain-containing protein n=1 Tax=Amphimedon queenslandica TaxID=400682 RepID=A0A1X7VQC2_AMPQE|nr:PREDICTED: zinc finger protein AEBP2-like [Amphimedon queenslandica]|eukprot:XP_011409594.1 PREDICTED: zinc finger protein AEBP2-like [Amphimedon queenslandica]